MNPKQLKIGGTYFRVVRSHWKNQLDTSYAARKGQRWNYPGTHCLYLNQDVRTAIANFRKRFDKRPIGVDSINPVNIPNIIAVEIPQGIAVDAYTKSGLARIGLPSTYPHKTSQRTSIVSYKTCQPIGHKVYQAGFSGIMCRSAAPGGALELAWFPDNSKTNAIHRGKLKDSWLLSQYP